MQGSEGCEGTQEALYLLGVALPLEFRKNNQAGDWVLKRTALEGRERRGRDQ